MSKGMSVKRNHEIDFMDSKTQNPKEKTKDETLAKKCRRNVDGG